MSDYKLLKICKRLIDMINLKLLYIFILIIFSILCLELIVSYELNQYLQLTSFKLQIILIDGTILAMSTSLIIICLKQIVILKNSRDLLWNDCLFKINIVFLIYYLFVIISHSLVHIDSNLTIQVAKFFVYTAVYIGLIVYTQKFKAKTLASN